MSLGVNINKHNKFAIFKVNYDFINVKVVLKLDSFDICIYLHIKRKK